MDTMTVVGTAAMKVEPRESTWVGKSAYQLVGLMVESWVYPRVLKKVA